MQRRNRDAMDIAESRWTSGLITGIISKEAIMIKSGKNFQGAGMYPCPECRSENLELDS